MGPTVEYRHLIKSCETAETIQYYMLAYDVNRLSEQFLNGTSAHIRLFSAIHSLGAVHGMVDSHESWI